MRSGAPQALEELPLAVTRGRRKRATETRRVFAMRVLVHRHIDRRRQLRLASDTATAVARDACGEEGRRTGRTEVVLVVR